MKMKMGSGWEVMESSKDWGRECTRQQPATRMKQTTKSETKIRNKGEHVLMKTWMWKLRTIFKQTWSRSGFSCINNESNTDKSDTKAIDAKPAADGADEDKMEWTAAVSREMKAGESNRECWVVVQPRFVCANKACAKKQQRKRQCGQFHIAANAAWNQLIKTRGKKWRQKWSFKPVLKLQNTDAAAAAPMCSKAPTDGLTMLEVHLLKTSRAWPHAAMSANERVEVIKLMTNWRWAMAELAAKRRIEIDADYLKTVKDNCKDHHKSNRGIHHCSTHEIG